MKRYITHITVLVIISLLSQSCRKFIIEYRKLAESHAHYLEQCRYASDGYPDGVEPEDVLDYYFVYTIDGIKYMNWLHKDFGHLIYSVSAGYDNEESEAWVYINQDSVANFEVYKDQIVHPVRFVKLRIPAIYNELNTLYSIPPEEQQLLTKWYLAKSAHVDSCNVSLSHLDKEIIAGSFEMYAHYTNNDDNVTYIKLENGLFKSRLGYKEYNQY